jgi:hypothetical protein
MKKPLLKTAQLIVAASVLFFISYSCSKQKLTKQEELKSAESTRSAVNAVQEENPFKETVGAPITGQTGRQWIENYTKANDAQGKSYLIQRKDLQTILNDPSCVGICLYFALDQENQFHILPIGVNQSGRLMKSSSINTQKGIIDWDTAQKWIASEPGAIDARFFGRNTFKRLFRDATCATVKATFAADEQQKPQLLLSNAAFKIPATFEDESAACPPVCPLIDQQQQ